MDYEFDQLFYSKEEKIILEALLKDAEKKGVSKDVEDIIFNGKCGSYVLSTDMCRPNNPSHESSRRLSMAYFYLTHPESFNYLKDNNIHFFHGTNSRALPSILKHGLKSYKDSKKEGIEVNTGEEWSRIKDHDRDFVSFTDIFEIAGQYSSFGSRTDQGFPIIIGIDKDTIKNHSGYTIRSSVSEVCIDNGINTSEIKSIIVPTDKIKLVKKMIGNLDIDVIGMDYPKDKFFLYFDESEIIIRKDAYQDFINNNYSSNKQFSFNIDDIKEFVKNNILSKFSKKNEENKGYDEHGFKL